MKTERHPALIALGQQIRKARQGRGISQETFAAEAGLGRSYYGGVERGDHNIAALNLIRIAAALDAEVGDLFPTVRELEGYLNSNQSPSIEEKKREP